MPHISHTALAVWLSITVAAAQQTDVFTHQSPLDYGDPELLVPFRGPALAFDWNGDGRPDLLRGGTVYLDTGRRDDSGLPVYSAPLRAAFPGGALGNLDGDAMLDCVLAHRKGFTWWEETRAGETRHFEKRGDLQHPLGRPVPPPEVGEGLPRVALTDWDGDGRADLITGTKSVGLSQYLPRVGPGFGRGWPDGEWYFRDMTATIYFHRNVGSSEKPLFTDGRLLTTGPTARAITFFDQAWPVVVDWNGDGRLDLFVSTFDRVVVFLNDGARETPHLDDGHLVRFGGRETTTYERRPVFPVRTADGRWRILIGGSQVRQAVATGAFSFTAPQLLHRHATTVRLSNFSVPEVADWDGDGHQDLIVGTEDGNVWFVRNLDPSGGPSRWAAPQMLTADGAPIRPVNQKHLQGPCEWWWAYTNPTVADWDLDGDLDIVLGYVGETYLLYENVGGARHPRLTARGPLQCGEGGASVSCAWRTRPGIGDMDGDGLPDLVGVDGRRRLCWWRRRRDAEGALRLSPPATPLDANGKPFEVCGAVRATGRTKLAVCDWDHDGQPDILGSPRVHDKSGYQLYFRNCGMANGVLRLELQPRRIRTAASGHYTMAEPVDFDGDGAWEIVSGRDSGQLYLWTL